MRYRNSNMRKCLATKTIARCAALFLFCLLPLKGICQTGESTVNTLVEMGFENVGWTEDGKERVYVLQNSASEWSRHWQSGRHYSKNGFTG